MKKVIQNTLILFSIISLMFLNNGCKKTSYPTNPDADKPSKLTLSDTSVNVSSLGGYSTILLNSSNSWEIKVSPELADWLDVDQLSGDKGNDIPIKLKLKQANTAPKQKSGEIKFILLSDGTSIKLKVHFLDENNKEPEPKPEPKPEPGPSEIVLLSLSVKNYPKTSFFIGESFSNEGIVVEGNYSDGTKSVIDTKKLIFSGFDSSLPDNNQIIKISFSEITTEIKIEIYPFEVQNKTEISQYLSDDINVIIPNGITKINDNVFLFKKLESISIPETVKEIGKYAFSRSSLKSITLPSSITTLGEGAFSKCKQLTDVDLSKTPIIRISSYLFQGCDKLLNITFPKNTIEIGYLAFAQNTSLKNIYLPKNLEIIESGAFRESGLETVSIPNNVRKIRQVAFFSCKSLKEVSTYGELFAGGVYESAFIESSAFQDVPSLTKLEIPKGISNIGQVVVSNAPNLKSIVIGSSIKKINFGAFELTGIERVIIESETPPQAEAPTENSWSPFPKKAIIEVPTSALNNYKKAFGWKLLNFKR